ncbi:hypothetical protein DFAR_1160009 [Desulfarculales bacterium]
MGLGGINAVALNETTSKRGHNYVTVFIDLNRKQKPIIFVTPGNGKGWLILFRRFLSEHGGDYNNIVEVVLRHVASLPGRHRRKLPQRQRHRGRILYSPTLYHLHGRGSKGRGYAERKLPKVSRRAVLKAADGGRLTEKQQ